MKNFILISLILLTPFFAFSQASVVTNNPTGGAFLGWNGAQDLDFKTNNINRMRLMQTSTTTVDGYAINNSGFLALSMDPNWFTQKEPYSLLHLNGEFNAGSGPISQEFGYRSWMKPGIVFTENGDLMYIGPKRNKQDITDAVISWADNAAPGVVGPDVLRFLFTDRSGGSTTVSSNPMDPTDWDGIETARMTGDARTGIGPMWTNQYLPHRTLDVIRRNDAKPQFRITYNRSTDVNWGINSDFQVSAQGNLHLIPRSNGHVKAVAIGFFDDPTNQTDPQANTFLDVGGRTRIRDLQDLTPRTLIMGYQFEDVNDGDNDHFLGRLDFPTEDPECFVLNGEGEWMDICDGIGGADCRWEDMNSATITGEEDMRMGVNLSDDCYRGKLGIGVWGLKEAKLEVHNYWDRDQVRTGIYALSRGDDDFDPDYIYGVQARTWGTFNPGKDRANTYVGVSGTASEGGWTVGVMAESSGSINSINEYTIGVYARANSINVSSNNPTIGMYSEGQIGLVTFGGSQFSQFPIVLSDESVKTEIQPLINATEILNQLQPKSYNLVNPEDRDLKLEDDLQFGFLAQDVEQTLPNLVEDFLVPDVLDSTGFVENTGLTLKGIQYVELIPLMIAGFQEQITTIAGQAAEIAAQNETIANLEAQLEEQATQLEQMQNDMQSVLAAVQTMQQKAANCCTPKTGTGETGALINENTKELELQQNVPNPFDSHTRITFNLPQSADVILEITDAAGRPLERLIDGKMSNGEHTTLWDGSKVASGIYFYTLYADGQLITKKMIKH